MLAAHSFEPDRNEIVSTFHSRQVAENALSGILDANARQLQRWLASGTKTLVLTGRVSQPLGLAILRGVASPIEATGIKLVLKRSPAMSIGFRIHTAMVIS